MLLGRYKEDVFRVGERGQDELSVGFCLCVGALLKKLKWRNGVYVRHYFSIFARYLGNEK